MSKIVYSEISSASSNTRSVEESSNTLSGKVESSNTLSKVKASSNARVNTGKGKQSRFGALETIDSGSDSGSDSCEEKPVNKINVSTEVIPATNDDFWGKLTHPEPESKPKKETQTQVQARALLQTQPRPNFVSSFNPPPPPHL